MTDPTDLPKSPVDEMRTLFDNETAAKMLRKLANLAESETIRISALNNMVWVKNGMITISWEVMP